MLPFCELLFGESQVFGFLGMCAPGVPVFFIEHPAIQAANDFFGYSRAKVVCPSPNDRVELSQDGWTFVPWAFSHRMLSFVRISCTDSLLSFNEEFPSRARGFRRRIVPHIEAKKVEPFSQVDDARLFLGEGQAAFFQPVRQDALHPLGIFLGCAFDVACGSAIA